MTTVFIALTHEELGTVYAALQETLERHPTSLALPPILAKIRKWHMRPRHEQPTTTHPVTVPVKRSES